jgi:hypothetical protein
MLYKKPDGRRDKLFEPGWAGELLDEEAERLQQVLLNDASLAWWWGWKPNGMKRRAIEAIKRVAYYGDPECRATNVRLVREAGRRAKEDNESSSASVSKVPTPIAPSSTTTTLGIQKELPLRTGRPKIHGLDREILKLDKQGLGCRRIAETLQAEGASVSPATVARRLAELHA